MSITLEFNTGAEIELRPTTVKDGSHQYLSARPASVPFVGKRGINVASSVFKASDISQLKSAKLKVDGHVVAQMNLTHDTNTSDNPRAHTVVDEAIDFDGAVQKLEVRLSQPGKGRFNTLIRTSRPSTKVHETL